MILGFVLALDAGLVLLGWLCLYLGCEIRLLVGIVVSYLLFGDFVWWLLIDCGCVVTLLLIVLIWFSSFIVVWVVDCGV